jgi:hypothetical protein
MENKQMSVAITYINPLTQEEITETINSIDKLRTQLESIQSKFHNLLDDPIGVELENGNGNTLSIGLGSHKWVLVFTQIRDDQDSSFAQLCSLGDESAKGTMAFYILQWTELPCKWLVPQEEAWEVVKYWFETGELSNIIRWTDENY